jgi:hypothetical protein
VAAGDRSSGRLATRARLVGRRVGL